MAKYREMTKQEDTYCHMSGKFVMVQLLAFVSTEMNKKREVFLALFCDVTIREHSWYYYIFIIFYDISNGTDSQKLLVCRSVKFFSQKIFHARKSS